MPTIKKLKLNDYSSIQTQAATQISQHENSEQVNGSLATTYVTQENTSANSNVTKKQQAKAKRQLSEKPTVIKQRKRKSIKLKDSFKLLNDSHNTSGDINNSNSNSVVKKTSKSINENLLTPYSKSLFDSIEYLSLTWSNIYQQKDLNTIEKSSKFELLRKFHCADCLKAFQSKMNNQAMNNNNNAMFTFVQQQQEQQVQQCVSQDSLQLNLPKNKQSLSIKLAQRRPKKELVEQGIIPSSKIPPMHYDQLKNLQKAQLQDYLKTKIEQRPNRELLVQKNILSDSKVSPRLQEHERKLKKARLAVDLNDKLLNRPGPLELVEHGILVSDVSLAEAIKDGKITYPKTTELRLKNRFVINDEQLAESPEPNDENDSNSSNSLGLSTLGCSNPSSQSTSTNKNNNDSGSFADFLNSLPSPTSMNEQKLDDISDQITQPAINTSSFLNNYQLPNQLRTKGSKKQKSTKSNGSKKVSQLIFHEYRGPNQKTSISKTNILPLSSPSAAAATNGYNFNDVDLNNGSIKANELSSYKIRLAQQKVYLYYDEKKPLEFLPSSPTPANPADLNEKLKLNTQTSVTQIPILPQPSAVIQAPLTQQPQQIIPFTTTNTLPSASTSTNSATATQSIQLLPINSIQIPENLKTILNSQQILSFISTPTASNIAAANKQSSNCIAIQPSPAPPSTQSQTQYANILPLTALQTAPTSATTNDKSLTIILPSASNTTSNGSTTVQQLISSAASSTPSSGTNNSALNAKSSNIDEMTMNELKEECRRRKLHVSGNKQTLIERIKKNANGISSSTIQQLQIVKSPDSGVGNMEYSPSFASSILGDHSPRSVASISFNQGSRPPSVANHLNNTMDSINNGSNNSKSHEDQINEERVKILQKIDELNHKLLQLNYQQPNNSKSDSSPEANDQSNFNIFIKSESTNHESSTSAITDNAQNSISNNNNNLFSTNNVIKSINCQHVEQKQSNRQSTIKQLSNKQRPIKLICNPPTPSAIAPSAHTNTTPATTAACESKNSNNKLRLINSMPSIKNNLNAFGNLNNNNNINNLTKTISQKSLDASSQYLIQINIPIVKENNFDNHLVTAVSTPTPPPPVSTSNMQQQQQQQKSNDTNFLSNSNHQQQQFINLIQVNNQQQQQQQQTLPSIKSLLNYTPATQQNTTDVFNVLNESQNESTKLPSIDTFSSKLKQQDGFHENNLLLNYHQHNNNEMEWNDTDLLFYTNETTTHSNGIHQNHHHQANDILFNFDSTAVNDIPQHDVTPSVNEFLSTAATVTTGAATSNNLFSIQNDSYFNEQNNKDQHQQQQQQFFSQLSSNQFNLENLFNDNTAFITSFQENTNISNANNEAINSNNSNNNNTENNRGATFYLDQISFDLIDHDFNQLNYLESPIV